MSPPKIRLRWWAVVAGLLPFLIGLRFVWMGADFGEHWDEHENILAPAQAALSRHLPLTGKYVYPSVNHWLAAAAIAPSISSEHYENDLVIRVRRLFGFVSQLAAVWLFAAAVIAGWTWWQGAVAAAFLAFSWQVTYHSRWIAPDALLMQFGALQILVLTAALHHPDRRVWYAGAIVSGLASATKYPGFLLIVPMLLLIFHIHRDWRQRIGWTARLLGIAALTFLVTTPGAILEFGPFWEAIYKTQRTYQRGWFGYTIGPGWEHASRLLEFLATQAFSPRVPVALGVFALSCAGAAAMWRDSRRAALVLLSFPVLYLIYFSLQRVMIIRNYLVVLPFLAYFAARGLALLPRPVRIAAVSGIILANLHWESQAAFSILRRHRMHEQERQVSRYISDHPDKRFAVTPRLRDGLAAARLPSKPNVVSPAESHDELLGWYSELVTPQWQTWKANTPGRIPRWFGPLEVDLNYYPGWAGHDHVIVLPPAR